MAARELSEVLTALCDFFVVVGPDWKFRQVDPRLQPLVGDVSGRDCWDVFSRVKGTALEREVRSAMEDRKERRFNYHDVVSRRWFQCRVLPGPDGSLRLLASEIAAPAQVETPAEPHREKGFSLRDAGFRDEPGSLAQLVSLLPAAVYTCDASGRITYFNQRAVELWGRAPEPEIDDRRFSASLRLAHPDGSSLAHEQSPMAMALRDGKGCRDQEVVIEQPSGQRVIVSVNVDPWQDAAGKRLGAIGVFHDITLRRKMESAWRESEERLRLATRTGKIGLWEWDIVHDRVTWTESLFLIHGVNPATFDYTSRGFSRLVHPEDRARVAEAVRRSLEEEAPYELEFRIRRPDGGITWIFTNATVLRENGQPTRMLGATMDITERKRATEELEKSEQRFVQFMRHLPGLAWIKDDQGRYVFVNNAAARVFGLPPEALHGRTDEQIFPAETAEQFRRNDRRARASDGGVQTLETLRHADDRLHHSIVSKFVIPAGEGRPPYVGGMAIDVTDRHDAEIALQEAHARLEQRVVERTKDLADANVRFRAIFDQGLFAALLSLDGTVVDVNRSWLEASGFSREELLQRPVWEAAWWRDSPDVQAWIKIGFGEASQGEAFRGETVFTTASGERRMLDLALMPIRDEAGQITLIITTALDSTERHRVERELQRAEISRASDARFRHLANTAPVLIWMADIDNAGTWFNQRWLDFVGRPLEQELGDGWLENVHPEDAERVSRTCGEALAVRRPFEMELRLRRHDGEYRWILDHGVPMFAPGGEFTGYIGTCIDITERKHDEITRQRLAAIVESSEDAIISHDLDGIITSWNRGAQRLFGFTPADMVGQSIQRLIPPERQPREANILERIRRGERILDLETVRWRDDGTRLHVSLSLSPVRDERGRIVGAAKILRDITERKRHETELQQREQVYRAVGESINYGIWIADERGANLYLSESFLRLVGLTQEQCSNQGWIEVLHPDEREPTVTAWRECVRTGTFWEREHRIQGVDGGWHPVLSRGVPVRREDGSIRSWVGINLDISRLKEDEEKLRRQARHLEILNRVGRTLAAERRLDAVVQAVTDASRELGGAAFAAFFYSVEGEAGDNYMLFALSGARREQFERFGNPRNTPLFGPTFRGEAPVRIDDVLTDPRYGTMAPHHGMPRGHLPVRSYLAVPVVSASGRVHGGLFLGHPEPGVFTPEAENLVVAMAAQAAIAMDNAHLYRDMQREIEKYARAERALRDSEERFRTLADNIAAFAWTADRLGEPTWFNKRWYEYTGVNPPEALGLSWEKIIHPEHLPRVRARLRKFLERAEVWEDTFPLRRHDGEWRWFLSRAVPIKDATGRVLRWFGTNTDITAQKQAEGALRQRSERMQLLSEMLAEMLSAEDSRIFADKLFPRVAEHLGVETWIHFAADEEREVLRLRGYAGISADEADSVTTLEYGQAICGTVARTRALLVVDDIQHTQNGTAAVVRNWGMQVWACNPLLAGGRLLGTLSFATRRRSRFNDDELDFLRVVAQSVAVALDRLRSNQALRDSEERFRTLADNIAQFAWTSDSEGWIFWFNRRWLEYTGADLADTEGWGWRDWVHPEHIARVLEKFARCVAAGETWEDTFPLRRQDGVYRWFLTRAVPIRDVTGRVVRWFGTNTDITEQREVELALERARDEALAASRAKDDFLAALSHELRTPLSPVLLLASDASANPALPGAVREDFETIRKNVSLEARLIDDLLDLTRISRGKLLLEFAPHDVQAILRDAIATVQADATEKHVSLVLELHASGARVSADAVRLQQVFWNVLKNAVKFTPSGGRIGIRTRCSGADAVEIQVADTGIGLSSAEIARIFDAFAQGDHARGPEPHRFGGLGLGLAISRMVVDLHHGSIRAESSGPGHGATFIITLPLLQRAAADPREPSAPAPATASGSPAGSEAPSGARILLVEDHAPTRAALERLLRRRRFDIATAATLAEAVAILGSERRFDLLISDVGLPDGSGCDLMREHGQAHHLPGIALTGYGMEQDVARSREAGFTAHLTKPVNVGELDRAIAEILGTSTR